MNNITFIGAGNIAQAIMGGVLASATTSKITAADPMPEQLAKLPDTVVTTTDNLAAIKDADIVLLCVKPNMMQEICKALAPAHEGKIFVSVAAGISTGSLAQWLGRDAAIVRCMPNTPALVNLGMTGLFANAHVSAAGKEEVMGILASVGAVSWFEDEALLDQVTAVSGSGPAYFFRVIEVMQAAAIELGLDPETSKQLVLQTALGAATMAYESTLPITTLRENVTSPGGTTAAALDKLNEAGLAEAFSDAMQAAYERSKALSGE